jgi:hypothetical protein
MVLAASIAAIAVVTNNPVLVVGAMIVPPGYGPMAGLSVAVVNWAFGPAWQGSGPLPWVPSGRGWG